MNPIGATGIQLEQQIPHNFRVRGFMIVTPTVLHLETLGLQSPSSVLRTEAKKGFNNSGLSVSLIMSWPSSFCSRPMSFLCCLLLLMCFLKLHFFIPHSLCQLQLQLSFGHTNFLPTLTSSISVYFPYHLTLLPLGLHLPFLPYDQKKILVQPAFHFACLTGDIWELLLLCPSEEVLKKWLTLMYPTTSKSISYRTSLTSSLRSLKSAVPMPRVEVLLLHFLLTTEILNLLTSWSLWPRKYKW